MVGGKKAEQWLPLEVGTEAGPTNPALGKKKYNISRKHDLFKEGKKGNPKLTQVTNDCL